eukprot:TRINITY_DN132_c0_g1_i6.p2 TRINITY_DN132_c0_g1~~TRINITY_DN132_c0_g1_i6.p2  ORF type:complete len:117 (+),score=1.36 TRINITY_DN132_c0_g1_i6:160-510(+)
MIQIQIQIFLWYQQNYHKVRYFDKAILANNEMYLTTTVNIENKFKTFKQTLNVNPFSETHKKIQSNPLNLPFHNFFSSFNFNFFLLFLLFLSLKQVSTQDQPIKIMKDVKRRGQKM